jgi:hypothetical protein
VDLDVTYPDGYQAREVLLVEMDSVTGGVLQADVVSREQAREQEMFPLRWWNPWAIRKSTRTFPA